MKAYVKGFMLSSPDI